MHNTAWGGDTQPCQKPRDGEPRCREPERTELGVPSPCQLCVLLRWQRWEWLWCSPGVGEASARVPWGCLHPRVGCPCRHPELCPCAGCCLPLAAPQTGSAGAGLEPSPHPSLLPGPGFGVSLSALGSLVPSPRTGPTAGPRWLQPAWKNCQELLKVRVLLCKRSATVPKLTFWCCLVHFWDLGFQAPRLPSVPRGAIAESRGWRGEK